jgi:hypothetical protein
MGMGQVASGSSSLPDPISLETEEEELARVKNECDAVGDYECPSSFQKVCREDVCAVVNIKTLKRRPGGSLAW